MLINKHALPNCFKLSELKMNHRRLNTFRTILTNSLNIVFPITYGSKHLLSNIYVTMGHLSKEEITLYASFALQAF